MSLSNYRTLGRSGLVVSPLALGAMTFGTARWGMDEAGSATVFNGRPGITSTLMGVSRSEQVADNAAALDVVLSAGHRAALYELSASADIRMLYSLFTPALRQLVVFGGSEVSAWETLS